MRYLAGYASGKSSELNFCVRTESVFRDTEISVFVPVLAGIVCDIAASLRLYGVFFPRSVKRFTDVGRREAIYGTEGKSTARRL